MRLTFLLSYILIMWGLIIAGSFILIRIIGPADLEVGELGNGIFKASIALSMVVIWLAMLVTIKNSYIRRKLSFESSS